MVVTAELVGKIGVSCLNLEEEREEKPEKTVVALVVTFVEDDKVAVVIAVTVFVIVLNIVVSVVNLLLEISVVCDMVVVVVSGFVVVTKLLDRNKGVVVNGSVTVTLLDELLSLIRIPEEKSSELEELCCALILQWHLLPPARTVKPNFMLYPGF